MKRCKQLTQRDELKRLGTTGRVRDAYTTPSVTATCWSSQLSYRLIAIMKESPRQNYLAQVILDLLGKCEI